jgi:hypothetical protein
MTKNTEKASDRPRARVVYDPNMPKYEYRTGEDRSMSVDRRRMTVEALKGDLLANLPM